MIRTLRPFLLLVAVAALAALLTGAARGTHNTDIHTDNIRVAAHDEFHYGTDLAFSGNLLAAGAADWDDPSQSGVYLYNLRNPASPARMGFAPCAAWHSDVGIWSHYVVQSHDDASSNHGCTPGEGQEGVRIIDVASPRKPVSVGFAETVHGSHNLSVVGNTGLVYVSSYNLTNPTDVDGVSIVDVAANPVDPPVTFLEFPDADATPEYADMRNESGDVPDSPGCHDIGINMARHLAYCAGITETMIWDISNPRDPVIISIIRNPAVNIHHGAYDNADGDVLILDDEFLGASGGPAACLAPNEPAGALWFYDISNPRLPVPLSYWSPPDPAPTDDFCTSHFYGTFPDRDWVSTSWYDHGVYLVDFSNPRAPTMVAQYDPGGAGSGATFWSAYPYKGYVYANSFAPATITDHDPANTYGGLWTFALDGYTPAKKTKGKP